MWVLKQLLEANNKISPSVIISNADTDLDVALKTFLPFVKHVYCIFYIYQNLDRYIQKFLSKNYKSFLSQFYSVRNCLNEITFNIKLNQLNKAFSCISNYLMGTLGKIKESWEKPLFVW
jgi:hypothetical protein